MADTTIEHEGIHLKVHDNGSGIYSLTTHTGGVGVADQTIEVQGYRLAVHDNGDGTFSPVTTLSTGAADVTIEIQGIHLKLHPTGVTDPNLLVPVYAITVVAV